MKKLKGTTYTSDIDYSPDIDLRLLTIIIYGLGVLFFGTMIKIKFIEFRAINKAYKIHFENYHHSPKIEATQTKADVVGMIAKKSIEAQIDPILSLRIAFKESSYNPIAKNKVSSAKGLYMFIDKTWKSYCTGDVYNAEDNLTCFLKLYPKHPDWWVKP